MNRSELVSAIAQQTGQTATDVDKALNGLIGVVTAALVKGDKVAIPGFATFDTSQRAARTGRNPQTGETMNIPARTAVKISAGQTLKRAVAG
jgi:DNA-binding protein HU-beta